MKHVITSTLLLSAGVFSLGCTENNLQGRDGEEAVRNAQQAFLTTNSLTTNALTTNALTTNGITTNGITTNGITTNGITTNGITTNGITTNGLVPELLAALQDPGPSGHSSRLFFHYMVNCALDASQAIAFSWTDSSGLLHNEIYTGAIGLAPQWLNNALTPVSASWVSACLGARTNWYGTSVEISIRGSHAELNRSPAGEQTDFPVLEGAFWGNLFNGSPQLYACYNSADMNNSRARNRDCAAGHLSASGSLESCGPIQIVGDCADYCTTLTSHGKYFATCGTGDPGSHTNEAITIWLHQ